MTILGKLSASEIKIRALKLLEVRSPHRAACASSVDNARLQDVGLRDRVAHLPSELSGGEQQRTTIARGQHASGWWDGVARDARVQGRRRLS